MLPRRARLGGSMYFASKERGDVEVKQGSGNLLGSMFEAGCS